MRLGRRTVLCLIVFCVLAGACVWAWTRGPTAESIGIAHTMKPPAGIAAARPDLLQHVFRFPKPMAFESIRLIHLDPDAERFSVVVVEDSTPTIWLLEPDPDFKPSDDQRPDYRRGASVKTQVLTIGTPVPGMARTDDQPNGPLASLVPGGHYRLEVEGEGLSGSIEFEAKPYARR